MDIHKPKPVHSWREFLSEICVIVTGIAIALGGEQAIEAIHWHHKVEAAEASIKAELGNNLRWALEVKQNAQCAKQFLDTFQTSVIANDTQTISRLDALLGTDDGPFSPAPWSSDTFKAALGSQVGEHLPEGRMVAYSREFTWIPLQMAFQVKLYDELATAMTARLGLPRTPDTLDRQLAAIFRLRSDENGRLDIAGAMLAYANENLAISPSNPGYIATNAAQAKNCEAQLQAIQTAAQH
ncbi:hypothetical protein AAKU67_003152 [Oxalobacteraceae bacterium GrIS 2.11]